MKILDYLSCKARSIKEYANYNCAKDLLRVYNNYGLEYLLKLGLTHEDILDARETIHLWEIRSQLRQSKK